MVRTSGWGPYFPLSMRVSSLARFMCIMGEQGVHTSQFSDMHHGRGRCTHIDIDIAPGKFFVFLRVFVVVCSDECKVEILKAAYPIKA